MDELKKRVVVPDDERLFDLAEMLRRGYMVEKVCEITGMDKFFVHKIQKIVDMEERLKQLDIDNLDEETLRQAMQALSGLSENNRLVGIISHVAELRSEIDKQLVVTKEKSGGSKVELKLN